MNPLKGKHLYHTGLGNNYMLNPQCEEKIQVIGTPFLYDEPEPSDLKLQETLFFINNSLYFILVGLKPIIFKPKFMFSFEANLEMKKHQFKFELLSVVS